MQDGKKTFRTIDMILEMMSNARKWAQNAWIWPKNENDKKWNDENGQKLFRTMMWNNTK